MNSSKKLHILFLVGLIIWLIGALSLSIYYFYIYRDFPWSVDADSSYIKLMEGLIASGMAILFLSMGLALLFVREALKRRSKLGFAVLIIGLCGQFAYFALVLVQPWRSSDLSILIPLNTALPTMGHCLMGAGIGILVFGGVLPRKEPRYVEATGIDLPTYDDLRAGIDAFEDAEENFAKAFVALEMGSEEAIVLDRDQAQRLRGLLYRYRGFVEHVDRATPMKMDNPELVTI